MKKFTVKKKRMYYIYRITNLINGKTYIGQHKYKDLNDNYMGSGVYLTKAKKKYGIENFTKEILEFDIPNVDLANDWEQMYILFERAKGKAEYNIADGGQGNLGLHHSEETKRKLSKANKGKHLSGETRKKISETMKGHKVSEETKRKIGEASSRSLKGKPKSEEARRKNSEGHRGKYHSEETKRKMSEAHKGKPKSEEWKRKMKGRIVSEETKKKISEALKGKHWKPVDGKRVWY